MNKFNSLIVTTLIVATGIAVAEAADRRYPLAYVQKIEITEPSRRTAWEDKDFLDCDDVVLTEEDVRYALLHMRRVSWSAYAPENTDTTGCKGSVLVTFKNGKILAMGIEPTGRITTAEYDTGMKVTASPAGFYECDPCRERKMKLLKDALYRADERRLKKLEAEGKIPPGEAERRLKTLRASR
ncbi:hypothetical protein [Variovorax atrisoli]|uniref:hypothetical protein n=1 Tax=Variovorax atrisoli TaxID=3394203 RepID=UPI00036A2735|nr:hypothetical protein [Variovorax paradoxus]